MAGHISFIAKRIGFSRDILENPAYACAYVTYLERQYPDDKLPYCSEDIIMLLFLEQIPENMPLLHNFDERFKKFHMGNYKLVDKAFLQKFMFAPASYVYEAMPDWLSRGIACSKVLCDLNLDAPFDGYPPINSVLDF